MSINARISVIALACASGWAMPAQAKDADLKAIQQQIAQMQSQMEGMQQQINSLQMQLGQANARASAAETRAVNAETQANAANAALAKAPAATATAKPATDITWDGAPKLATKDGWSFKPRGRMQLDAGGVNAPAGVASAQSLGWAAEFRRVYLGFDGTMPGGIGYRVEADLANSSVDLTDVYLTYKANPKLTLTVGQHKPFSSMEDMTSDLFTSMMERAAFNSAFGFERRVGVSATYLDKSFMVQAGAFSDNAADLNNDRNNSYSLDARVVFMPKLGDGQLHLGGSYHYRDFNDAQTSTRYRARPFLHTTDVRLVDTGAIASTGERSIGAEFAYINGRFHATAESHWMTALRPALTDPTFNGGYAEVGYLLTDDTTAYKAGAYDRIRPKSPVGKGGIGAIQINTRYEWLNLNSGAIVGGKQEIAGISAIWMPTDYVRFIANYGHIWLNNAAVPAGAVRNYSADSIGMRAQFDF